MNKIKIKVPFSYGKKDSPTYFAGIAFYFIVDGKIVKEIAEISEAKVSSRLPKNYDTWFKTEGYLNNKKQDIQILKRVLGEKQVAKSHIEIDSKVVSGEDIAWINQRLKIVQNTISSLGKYFSDTKVTGGNKNKRSNFALADGKFKGYQFIHFFTNMLREQRTKFRSSVVEEKSFEEITIEDFLETNEFYLFVFQAMNDTDSIDNNQLKAKLKNLEEKKKISFKQLSFNKQANFVLEMIEKDDVEITTDFNDLEFLIKTYEHYYKKEVEEFVKLKKITKDSVYGIFSLENTQKCHIWEKRQIKVAFKRYGKKEVLKHIMSGENVIFLTPTIHTLWDNKKIYLNGEGRFENRNLSDEEWKHLNLDNWDVFRNIGGITILQKKYLDLRNKAEYTQENIMNL